MKERIADYEKYNQEFYQSMNIDPQAVQDFVVPMTKSEIQEYTDFAKNVSETQDPYMTSASRTSALMARGGPRAPSTTSSHNYWCIHPSPSTRRRRQTPTSTGSWGGSPSGTTSTPEVVTNRCPGAADTAKMYRFPAPTLPPSSPVPMKW